MSWAVAGSAHCRTSSHRFSTAGSSATTLTMRTRTTGGMSDDDQPNPRGLGAAAALSAARPVAPQFPSILRRSEYLDDRDLDAADRHDLACLPTDERCLLAGRRQFLRADSDVLC